MDYHKKYLKYKFKYYNLLNQSGGGYTDDEFKNILEKTDENGFLVEKLFVEKKLEDPITLEPIHKDKAILINNQIYDVNSLFESINEGLNTVPLDRQAYKLTELLDIRNKLDNKKDKTKIDNLIFLELPETIIFFLLKLNKEERDILLTINKIEILKKLDKDTIENLLTKFKYLFNNNNDNIIEIKNVIKSNCLALLFIPEKHIYYINIIESVVKNDGFALLFIPKDIKESVIIDICKIAVQNNGLALQYVPKDIKEPVIIEICKIAVQNNGLALQYVHPTLKGLALELVVPKETVPKDIKESVIIDICKIAVQNNGLALQYVHPTLKGLALEFPSETVPKDIKEQVIIDICKIAIIQNQDAYIFVPDELVGKI
jgi:hypothetical protein